MSSNLIFSIVFFIQVILLSWYLVRKVQARILYVIQTYPATEYPKLYSGDQKQVERSYWRLVIFNKVMLIIGLGILIWINLYAGLITGGQSAMISFLYGMCQAAPIFLMDLALMRHYKKLRQEDERTKRTAQLTPRSLFNHTTVGKLVAVIAVFIIAIVFDFYTKGFDISLGIELFEAAIILGLTNLFFVWLVRKRVYGKKLNPYLDEKDSKREIDVVVASAMFTSVAVSIFFMAMRAINVYDLEHFEGVLMSIYMQTIIGYSILYSMSMINPQDVNFEPFRAEAE